MLRSDPECNRRFLGSLSFNESTYTLLLDLAFIMLPSRFTLLKLDLPISFENVESSKISLLLEQSVRLESWERFPKKEIIKVLKEPDEASLQKLSFLWVFMTRKAIIELASEVDLSILRTILETELREAINTKRLIDYALILIRLRSLQVYNGDFMIDLKLFEEAKNVQSFFLELTEYVVLKQSESLKLFCGKLENFGYGGLYDVVVDAVHGGKESRYFSIDDVVLEYMTLLLATCIYEDPKRSVRHIDWAIQSIAPFDGKHLSWERVLFQSIDNIDSLLLRYFLTGHYFSHEKTKLQKLQDSILMSQRHGKNIKFLAFLANGRHEQFTASPFFKIAWAENVHELLTDLAIDIGRLRLQELEQNPSLISKTWLFYCHKAKGVIEEAKNKGIITWKEGNTHAIDQKGISDVDDDDDDDDDDNVELALFKVVALLRFEIFLNMTLTILLDGESWSWLYTQFQEGLQNIWGSSKIIWDGEEYAQNLLTRYNYDPEMSCSAIVERKEEI